MLHEFHPRSLADLAKAQGLHPFELLRSMVSDGTLPQGMLCFDPDSAPSTVSSAAREIASSAPDSGISAPEMVDEPEPSASYADSWWIGVSYPVDANSKNAVVRAALSQLVERGIMSPSGVEIGQVAYGLPMDDAALVRDALRTLASEGYLMAIGASQVAVRPETKETIEQIAAGTLTTEGLRQLVG